VLFKNYTERVVRTDGVNDNFSTTDMLVMERFLAVRWIRLGSIGDDLWCGKIRRLPNGLLVVEKIGTHSMPGRMPRYDMMSSCWYRSRRAARQWTHLKGASGPLSCSDSPEQWMYFWLVAQIDYRCHSSPMRYLGTTWNRYSFAFPESFKNKSIHRCEKNDAMVNFCF